MTTPTLEDFHRNPDLRRQLVQAAHRQRNAEIGRLFVRFYQLLKANHAARPDFASQG